MSEQQVSQSFIDDLSNRLRPLLSTLEDLNMCGLQNYISLPRIAVVGSQSAGKTSVLESILRRSILPKGNELATRLPIVLMLRRVTSMQPKEYAFRVGETQGELEDVDYDDLGECIDKLQDDIAGTCYEIVNIPIFVEVRSKEIPELTLVDLPGLAKNKRKGSNQPNDIQQVTTQIIKEYIQDPATVILAVIPANQDIQTSDAILLAREVDPEGERTIGVLTKIDIMDRGTHARGMLEGEIVDLKLGYVGVVNRSQKMVDDEISIEDALLKEKEFFASHDVYRTMSQEFFGVDQLSVKLMEILRTRITDQLPKIGSKAEHKLQSVIKELEGLGDALPKEDNAKYAYLLKLVTKVCSHILDHLKGKSTIKSTQDEGPKFFISKFKECSHQIESLTATNSSVLKEQIARRNNATLPTFSSFETFREIINEEISKLQGPGEDLLLAFHSHIESVFGSVLNHDLKRFPKLRMKLVNIMSEQLKVLKAETMKKLKDYYLMVKFPYTSQNAFVELAQPETPNATIINKLEIKKYQNRLLSVSESFDDFLAKMESYLKIQRQSFEDHVPKTVGCFLLEAFTKSLEDRSDIIPHLSLEEGVLDEDTAEAKQRHKLEREQEVLEQALRILKNNSI